MRPNLSFSYGCGAETAGPNRPRPPIWMWLCNELLADVFKFLPHSELANSVQPSNRRLNAICEQKVDNVHIISKFSDFLFELACNSSKANNHLATLTSSTDECNLGKHFRLDHRQEVEIECRLRKHQLALLHSLDLFRFCRLHIYPTTGNAADVAFLRQYLTIIRPLRPQQVGIGGDGLNGLRWGQLLCSPVAMDCSRVSMTETAEGDPRPEDFFRWLHHQVVKKDEETVQQTTRLLNGLLNFERSGWEQFVQLCSQHFFASTSPADRHIFLLSFGSARPDLPPFKLTNANSGEVLAFGPEHIPLVSDYFVTYRLRRCPHADATEAATQQFYDQMFNDRGDFRFTEEERARGAGVNLVLC